MGLAFAIGSACFLVGPFPGYANLVGAWADALTFFVGSVFFTAGGALQTSLAHDRAAWWTAVIQSAGTPFGAACFLACAVGTLRAPTPVDDSIPTAPTLLTKEAP